MAHDRRLSPAAADALGRENHAELRKLRYHWGDGAYRVDVEFPHDWSAVRCDDGETLTADSAAELRALIVADYSRKPVPRQPEGDREHR